MNQLYVFIFIFISTFLIYLFNKNLEIYEFGKKLKKSINILIVGGTHGNEPSSSLSLYKLIYYLKKKKINNAHITIIPMVNKFGFYTSNRYSQHFLKNYDINRKYPNKYYINSILTKYIKKADMVIDHHEGYNYHIYNKHSIGSSLSPVNFNKKNLQKILDNLNKNIDKNFLFNEKKGIPKNSLRDYIKKNYPKKKYLLIETTGIHNKEPLHLRQYKSLYIIISILKDKQII